MAVAFAAVAAGLAADRAPVLERVVMIARHGVRSPIRPLETLDALTQRTRPRWPVGPGEMTEHGARSLALMVDFLRVTFENKGLLPKDGCPPQGALDVWADAADRRTRRSGEIFADRLAPGCDRRARHAGDAAPDPLFDASLSRTCPAPAGVGPVRATAADLRPQDLRALHVLQDIVAPAACDAGGTGICLIPSMGSSNAKVASNLGLAATIAEGLYLEYAQGFPPNAVGWGKAGSEATIAAVMPAYERGFGFMRRNPALSARRGALLVRTILNLLQGRAPPAGAPALSRDAELTVIAGHDSNLLQAAVLMGLDWRLPDQPSATPPDATLAFEVWRDPATDRRTVKVIVFSQTLRQIREETPLDPAHPPDVVAVAPLKCGGSGGGCDLATFAADVERRLAALCGG